MKINNELILRKAVKEKKNNALYCLTLLDFDCNQKSKIENIITNSRLNDLYCDYFLADNPSKFKSYLRQNKQFRKEARNCGLELKILKNSFEDKGVEIKFDLENQKYLLTRNKIINYFNQYFSIVNDFYEKIILSSINQNVNRFVQINLDNGQDLDEIVDDYFMNICNLKSNSLSPVILEKIHSILPQIVENTMVRYYFKSYRISKTEENKNIFFLSLNEFIKNIIVKHYNSDYFLKVKEKVFFPDNYLTKIKPCIINSSNLTEITNILSKSCLKFNDLIKEYLGLNNFLRVPFVKVENFIKEKRLAEISYYLESLNLSLPHSKFRDVNSAKYFLKLEPLLPEDVTFGNDSDSCQAVKNFYTNQDSLGLGDNIPFYQLDEATLIFGIYQQLNTDKLNSQKRNKQNSKRIGMVLSFVTVDTNNNPVLLCDFHDFSTFYNPLSNHGFNKLVNHTFDYLTNFSRKAGFKKIAIGTHNFNPCLNYLDDKFLVIPDYKKEELMKLPDCDEVEFYSGVLDNNGISKPGQWSYIKSSI